MTDSCVNSWMLLLADGDREHLGLQPRALAGRARAEAHVLLDPLALLRRVGLAVAALEARDDALEGEHVRAPAAHPVAVLDVDARRRSCRRGSSSAARSRQLLPGRVEVDLVAVGDRLDHRLVEARVDRPPTARARPRRSRATGRGRAGPGRSPAARRGPVQRGQAPCGELNEKMRGCSSGSETPCSGQANLLARTSSSRRSSTRSIATSPSASCGRRLDRLRRAACAGRASSRAGRRRPRSCA